LFEILILLINPIPFYERYVTITAKKNIQVVYFLSEFLISFMVLRFYFILRSIFNFSIYSDSFSKQLCRIYSLKPGVFFTMKCYLINHPETTVLSLLSFTVFVFSYVFRIYELPYFRLEDDLAIKNSLDSYFTSIYVTVITFTSVGYGDISAGTPPGRFVVIVLSLWGAF
jgi:hypothetical protein